MKHFQKHIKVGIFTHYLTSTWNINVHDSLPHIYIEYQSCVTFSDVNQMHSTFTNSSQTKMCVNMLQKYNWFPFLKFQMPHLSHGGLSNSGPLLLHIHKKFHCLSNIYMIKAII
jgi:hypothetical protein